MTNFDHHIGAILVNNRVSNGNPNNVTFATQVYNPAARAPVGAHFNVLIVSS